MTFYCDLSKFNWPDLLVEASVKNDQTVFYNAKKGMFFLDAKDNQTTDQAIRKLNLSEILDFTERLKDYYATDAEALWKLGLALKRLANHTEKQQNTLETNSKISTFITSFFNSINGKGFQTTADRAYALANQLFNQLRIPAPILYSQGQKEIQRQVSVQKLPDGMDELHPVVLGTGSEGTVYIRRIQESHAVKKSFYDIHFEYMIGMLLQHPNLNKTHRLYIKHYDSSLHVTSQPVKYKLVMDKIEGVRLADIYRNRAPKLPNEVVQQLLKQAEDCCLYLFDQNITWKDVNAQNIFVTKDNQLKICDFGYWKRESDSQKKAISLLLGSMELVGWIMINTKSFPEAADDPDLLQNILFPSECFDPQTKPPHTRIYSNEAYKYKEEAWLQNLKQKLSKMNDGEKQAFLKNYFKRVWVNFVMR